MDQPWSPVTRRTVPRVGSVHWKPPRTSGNQPVMPSLPTARPHGLVTTPPGAVAPPAAANGVVVPPRASCSPCAASGAGPGAARSGWRPAPPRGSRTRRGSPRRRREVWRRATSRDLGNQGDRRRACVLFNFNDGIPSHLQHRILFMLPPSLRCDRDTTSVHCGRA